MVYTAGSISLATLELLVHLDSTAALPLYSICSVDFDDSLVEVLDPARLPSNWHQSPPPMQLQAIGDNWISLASSVVLGVPSAIVEDESNYLINPAHTDFAKLVLGRMKSLDLDSRLLRPGTA
jgi:RES domain-containing protein